MGKTSTAASLDPLHKTIASLKEIRLNLLPFVKLLKDDDDSARRRGQKRGRPDGTNDGRTDTNDEGEQTTEKLTPHQRAEAEAAVALAMGTLRYMGARLRGLDRGRKKGDPLRTELDKMRGVLVSLRKLEGEDKKKGGPDAEADADGTTKRKKADDDKGRDSGSPSKKQRKI